MTPFWVIVTLILAAGYALTTALAVLVLLGLLVIVARAVVAGISAIHRGGRHG